MTCWYRRSRRGIGLLGLLISLHASSVGLGANGDLVGISTALAPSRIVDITMDINNGTYWVLDVNSISESSHLLHHLSGDLRTELGVVSNPHPPGSIETNDITDNRGIAYRSLTRTLLVLAKVGQIGSQEFRMVEITTDGVVNPASAFTVQVTDPDASLFGLDYDFTTREFWTLDVQNDRVLRFAPGGAIRHSFTLPGKTTPETRIRGRGIAFDREIVDLAVQPYIYVTYGDIFTPGPSEIIQLTPEGVLVGMEQVGERTGIEVPLDAIPGSDPDLGGFHISRIGAQRRINIVGSKTGRIYQLEQVISNPIPPGELTCTLTLGNETLLTWRNHGSGAGGAYGGVIQVLRNGVPFTTIPGDSETFMDAAPVEGTSTYSLRSSDVAAGPFSATSGECRVTVGTGGLINWRPAPGSAVYDLTRNPTTGDLFVTDSVVGKIFKFAADLTSKGEVPSPWPDPGGIAFVPAIQLGFPPSTFNDLLAVASASGRALRFIDLAGNQKTAFTLTLDPGARIGGLTFIASEQRFALMELTTRKIFVTSGNGTVISSCEPPFLINIPFDRAITYDPIQQTFLTGFQDGVVRELFSGGSCPQTGFEFGLESLGQDFDEPGFVGGFEIAGNTLYVGGRQNTTNAIYQILIFPFENTFIRGDFDKSDAVNVTDVVSLASYLFQAGPAPPCLDAADANDDGILDIADPVYLLFWLFVASSPPPPAPHPDPGSDPTFRDNLGCAG